VNQLHFGLVVKLSGAQIPLTSNSNFAVLKTLSTVKEFTETAVPIR